jgi:hypothetical protein
MKLRHFTTLHSDLGADECRCRLIESIDEKRFRILSLTGYKGSKPLIGWLEGYKFFMQKRRYRHNAFAPQCHGVLIPQREVTLIEGSFDIPRITKISARIWLGGVVLLGTPLFILSLMDLFKVSKFDQGNLWLGLVLPPAMTLFGIFFPKIGLLLGCREEEYMLEFLQTTLVARVVTAKSANQTGPLSSP